MTEESPPFPRSRPERVRRSPLLSAAGAAAAAGWMCALSSPAAASSADSPSTARRADAPPPKRRAAGAGGGAGAEDDAPGKYARDDDIISELEHEALRARPPVPGRPPPSLDAARPYLGLAAARIDGIRSPEERERLTRSFHMVDHDDGVDLRLGGLAAAAASKRMSSESSGAGSGAMRFSRGDGDGDGDGRNLQQGTGNVVVLDEEDTVLCVTSLDTYLDIEGLSSVQDEDDIVPVSVPGILEGQFLAEYIMCYGRSFDLTYYQYDNRKEAVIEYMNVLDQKMGIFLEEEEVEGEETHRRDLQDNATESGAARPPPVRKRKKRVRRRTKVREKVRYKCGSRCRVVKDDLVADSLRRRYLAEHDPDHPTHRRLVSFESEMVKCLADNGYVEIGVTCGSSAEDAWTATTVEEERGDNGNGGGTGQGGGTTIHTFSGSERARQLRDILLGGNYVVDPSTLDDPSTPQYRALKWIADKDPAELTFSDEDPADRPQLIQRWVFAVFYYSVGGGEGHWIASAYYMSEDHVCLWNQQVPEYGLDFPYKGNFCSQGMVGGLTGKVGWVDDITLPMNNLRGKIPPEIGLLKSIIYLNLSDNELEGSIPTEIGFLTELKHLALQTNRFTGKIPPTIGSCSKLQELSLGWNALTGEIPVHVNNLLDLQILFLSQNHLSGNLNLLPGPERCQSLMTVEIRDNDLSGPIPEGLPLCRNLFTLDVSRNGLSGNLPADIGDLPYLGYFDASDNMISGPIPPSLGRAATVSWVNLARNELEGDIPDLSGMTGLMSLNLEMNELTGQPDLQSLVQLGQLQYLTLHRNNFVGSLNGLCRSAGAGGAAGNLELLVSDCYDGLGAKPEIECVCCNSCCSDIAGHCFYKQASG